MASDRDTLTATLARDIRNGDHRGEIGHAQSQRIAGGLIELGWRPPAQVITTDQAQQLPDGCIVRRDGKAWEREHGQWWHGGVAEGRAVPYGSGPITVVWSPTEKAGQ